MEVTGKAKLPLRLTIKHYTMKMYWESECIDHVFLISALVGGEWSVSMPDLFTPEKVGWVSPRTGLDVVEKKNS
jgi:hypothetical protein